MSHRIRRPGRARPVLAFGLIALFAASIGAFPGHADRAASAELTTTAAEPATIAPELTAVAEAAAAGEPVEALPWATSPEPASDTTTLDAVPEAVPPALAPVVETLPASADSAIEIVVLFEDRGVAPAAQGDPADAARSLQQQADERWSAAAAALDALEHEGKAHVLTRFWITSAVLVSAAPAPETLAALAALPGAVAVLPNFEVTPLDAEEFVPLSEPTIPASLATADGTPLTYGLERIRASETWRDYGAEGQGVRVAVLDTGVDATHPDIAGRLVGSGLGDSTYPGGWISFDRTGQPVVSRPSDPGSHGTHVAGTVLGGSASGTQIGVAPRAELMAANVLSGSGGGSLAKILAGMQWAISPTDAWGNPAGRAADVVNMSLGSSGYSSVFIPFVRNLRQAGVFPAIAIGNAPCGPTGTSSPGDVYDAFGVGMTNAADEVDPGSCGAVTSWPTEIGAQYGWPQSFVKPDASAPGSRVFSALPNGLWGESTGTSMATPHVAGAVALIRSAQAGLSVDQIEEALESTAWHPAGPGAPADTRYGHGRIDVHAAVAAVLGQSGIEVTARDAITDEPLPGVALAYGERGETWTTDAAGHVTARLAPGVYELQASRFGYESATSGAITVSSGAFARVDLPLQPITVGSIAGIVVDAQSGAPLEGATVQVVGHPLTTTTSVAGEFAFDDLPIGSYRILVTADEYRESVSQPAEVRAALQTLVNYRMVALPRAAVLGDNGGRTAALLGDNGFAAWSYETLPDELDPAAFDIVVWDAPAAVPSERLESFLSSADAAGTGLVWLDLGASDDSGIAQLQRATGNPAARSAGNDRTLTATVYEIVADHEIFAGGTLSADPLGVGDELVQNSVENGPKFFAWFEGLTGEDATVLARTFTRAPGDDATDTELGDGIAVVESPNSRQALLSLHGSSPAVDTRTWSLASAQVFVNAVAWSAPPSAQAHEPVIIVPEPPVIDPGDGGNPTNPGGNPPATGGGTTPPPAPQPAAQAAPRAAAQSAAKPATTPDPPVDSIDRLGAHNAGGLTVSVESGIAYVRIPEAVPGTWYFLHVYPSATPVDWIRVNDDGQLRIDIARLRPGDYRFAFTDASGALVGWVPIVVAGATGAAEAETAPAIPLAVPDDPAAPVPSGPALSAVEQLMLLGAGLLILATAILLLMSARRRPPSAPA